MSLSPVSAQTSQTQTLDSQAFLRMLVAQLQNQDPLEPMSSPEFMTQLAQLQTAQETTEVNKGIQQLLGMQQWSQTLGLLGRNVTARDPQTGEAIQGTVEGIDLGAGSPGIIVKGLRIDLSDILSIST